MREQKCGLYDPVDPQAYRAFLHRVEVKPTKSHHLREITQPGELAPLMLRDMNPVHQQVDIRKLPRGDIAIELAGECRALVRQHLNAFSSKPVANSQQLTGQEQSFAQVGVIAPAQRRQLTFLSVSAQRFVHASQHSMVLRQLRYPLPVRIGRGRPSSVAAGQQQIELGIETCSDRDFTRWSNLW